MNRRRPSVSLLFFAFLVLFAMLPNLRAADGVRKPITVALQFTPGSAADRGAYTSTVPQMVGEALTLPIQVSSSARWLVSISIDDGSQRFHISVVDPTLVGPVNPFDLFYADFALAFGKPIAVLKTTAGTLEITFTKD